MCGEPCSLICTCVLSVLILIPAERAESNSRWHSACNPPRILLNGRLGLGISLTAVVYYEWISSWLDESGLTLGLVTKSRLLTLARDTSRATRVSGTSAPGTPGGPGTGDSRCPHLQCPGALLVGISLCFCQNQPCLDKLYPVCI